LLVPLAATLAAPAHAQGDVAAGEQVFRKCQACHSIDPGQNRVGPSLFDVIGRSAGSLEGYSYSVAMSRSDVVWTPETLDEFLASPWEYMHGTKMIYTGLKDPEDRANVIAYLAAAPSREGATPPGTEDAVPPTAPGPAEPTGRAVIPTVDPSIPAGYSPDVRYTLKSGIAEGRMVFIGVGADIDGVVNPQLTAAENDIVQITLINGEGAQHDIVFPEQNIASQHVIGIGASTTIAFRARAVGEWTYFCSVPGHRLAGMEGRFVVSPARPPEPTPTAEADISLPPTSLAPPITRREPRRVEVTLESVELEGRLADGTTYPYWTFNRTVPGPFIRVRVGDTIEVTLKNDVDASMIHSVDFHATTGPGGGATHLQVDPGDEKTIEFKALVPGLFVYHCATPMVAHHIANGMYGLILVEPEEGLPKVDHEFYVMQGEIYTTGRHGERGSQEFSVDKLLDEQAEYVVFNGNVGALTTDHPLQARVGETVRIFVGVGGPNYTSSFHVIGEIFDRAYAWGDVISPPARGVQTITVPPGGSAVVEFELDVPGRYLLVDHALSRVERGLVGFLIAEGEENPEIYKPYSAASDGH
jgi:nitrite reductase (NO-forming)